MIEFHTCRCHVVAEMSHTTLFIRDYGKNYRKTTQSNGDSPPQNVVSTDLDLDLKLEENETREDLFITSMSQMVNLEMFW